VPNYTITPGNTRGFVIFKTARGKIRAVLFQKISHQYKHLRKKVPATVWITLVVGVSSVLIYTVIFFIPKTIQFSYAGDTCIRQLVLLPGIQSTKADAFDVSFQGTLQVAGFTYAATKVCVTPRQAPVAGTHGASVGLLGGWYVAKHFKITVAEPPVAQTSDLIGKSLSTTLPLTINLSSADTIHAYQLEIDGKQADCSSQNSHVSCAIADLQLSPGAHYSAVLYRSFDASDKTKIVEGTVQTLLPIVVQSASVSEGQTIYDTPKEFSFTFDKPVKSADATLDRKNGETTEKVASSTRFEGNTVFVTVSADLARKAGFSLTLHQVVSDDGSSLQAPITTQFTTSGGPKPASVSVGSTGVAQNAQIIVTLDQPIKDDADITKLVRVDGVPGRVVKRSPTELVYSLQAGLCNAFSLVLDKGLASGSNAEVSEAWRFDARTICGVSSVIGTSTKGRSINAYYFGNGATTVLFTGGMHGSEPSGATTMQAWVTYLMSYGYKIPADKRVVIVPNTNPDGIAAGSRNSATNVNIDRNFPTNNWKTDIETTGGVLTNGGGTSAGSEPETKALMAVTQQLRPRLEVSFHAQGRLVGANKFGDSVAIGSTYAKTVGYTTMFDDAEAVMGYPMTGEYEDWMGERFGIPAILVELPSSSGNYLTSQLNALWAMLSV
jgi:protein MpaA